MTIKDRLTKALHSSQFTVSDLREALKTANGVEALVILDLIEQATKTMQRIDALLAAL